MGTRVEFPLALSFGSVVSGQPAAGAPARSAFGFGNRPSSPEPLAVHFIHIRIPIRNN